MQNASNYIEAHVASLVAGINKAGVGLVNNSASFAEVLQAHCKVSQRTAERALQDSGLLPEPVMVEQTTDEKGLPVKRIVLNAYLAEAKRKRYAVLNVQLHVFNKQTLLVANNQKGLRYWVALKASKGQCTPESLLAAFQAIADEVGKHCLIWPVGNLVAQVRALHAREWKNSSFELCLPAYQTHLQDDALNLKPRATTLLSKGDRTHLDALEAESMHIMREVVAQAENPVMLYSIGKDSAVMLHLARKAFYPAPPPFPLMHVDTQWKFKTMYQFRDLMAKHSGMELLVHVNPDAIEKNINPFDHGSSIHTDITKTVGLKQALDKYKFDAAFGGARRDEEKSRAKERIFSFRTTTHQWDPKNQRPELWSLYNARKNRGESMRVFPLSNWTELDIWQYIYREGIPIVPLYFAQPRPVVKKDGILMMVDDDRLPMQEGDEVEIKWVRFRTLGCYPLTGAVESTADTLEEMILELLESNVSEREGRAIDKDSPASMEKKKQEGYF